MRLSYESAFRMGMYWRILYGFIRILLGLSLLGFLGKTTPDIVHAMLRPELIEDPGDILAGMMLPILTYFSFTITAFLPVYFIFWGSVDAFLSWQLIKHRLWAFPLSISLMTAFTAYESYRVTHTHSLILVAVIVIDIILIGVVAGEYRRLMRSARSDRTAL